jgi:glycerol-3-phosphate O-acyltransferase
LDGGERITAMWRAKRRLIAGAMVPPFFEACELVADVLTDAPAKVSEHDLTATPPSSGRCRLSTRCG